MNRHQRNGIQQVIGWITCARFACGLSCELTERLYRLSNQIYNDIYNIWDKSE